MKLALSIVACLYTGCNSAQPHQLSNPSMRVPVPVSQPVAVDPYKGYFFVASTARRDFLARAVSALQLGSPVDLVVKMLGRPDQDEAGGQKFLLPRQHRSRVLTYLVARIREDGLANNNDQIIYLWFDADGRLELIDSLFPAVQSRQIPGVMDNSPKSDWWKSWSTKRPTTQKREVERN